MRSEAERETDRLLLRQWRETDREPFARLNADQQVMKFFPSPLTRDESDRLADRLATDLRVRGWGIWAVELKSTREFIGFVGLQQASSQLPMAPCVEVGWRLSSENWGQGFATEAARAALEVGFEELRLDEIVSFTAALNTKSVAVMRRLSMLEDKKGFDHPAVPLDSPLRPHRLFRLTRTRWLATRRLRPR